MPIYTVTDTHRSAPWNLTKPPPGEKGNRPFAEAEARPNTYTVLNRQWQNFRISKLSTQALQTELKTERAACFCILYLKDPPDQTAIASLINMPDGPDAAHVPWYEMVAGMDTSGTQYGVLVTTKGTGNQRDFTVAAQEDTNIQSPNMWVYNAQQSGFTFAVDYEGDVGQVT